MRIELPEKWFIELKSQSEFDEFLKWAVDKAYLDLFHLTSKAYSNPYYCSFNSKNNKASYNNINSWSNYIELTFEEFKTLVLNKNNEPQYEIY